MSMKTFNRAAMPVALACCAVPAQAADVAFSGSMTGNSVLGAPTCPVNYFHTSVTGAAGTSPTLNAFTYNSDVCQRAGFPFTGTFSIILGDGSFAGTQAGLAMPAPGQVGIPTLFNLLINYTITSGTGAYAGATGSFIGEGTVNNGVISLNFRPVPEPATWAMMLVGFAGIGMAMRRMRARARGGVMQLA